MDAPPENINFAQEEAKVLEQWTKNNTFERSLELSKGRPLYSFYDGPPFATGLPHYGHILAGTIKDIVTRFAHQTGHHVERRFGWDCHGLPVEYEIDQKLGIKSKDDVMKMGIPAYNAECRSIVSRYCGEWERIVKRLGRWIDFDNDYKTMEPWYMESVWWVFKTMFEKGLVYRGFKVMPFSTACNTPLSNFEANLNYKDAKDPAVIVSFPLVDEPECSMLAWTTTPWTLPSNLGLCVHPELDYVKIKDTKEGHIWIVGEARLISLYPKMKSKKYKGGEFEVLEKMKGAALGGKKYVPLFDYYKDMEDKAFRVMVDTYVTDDSGTGVVHQAPAFGEDDYRVCLANGVVAKGEQPPCPIDVNGRFEAPVVEYAGKHVKEADPFIMDELKKRGRLVNKSSIVHSYPFCWRSDTPLIYRTIPSWFVNVESIKDKLIANNLQTYWVPAFVKEKRFHNWLSDARDWAISRNRYWGTPLPLWVSEDFQEVVCVGSIDELAEKSGVRVDDLHRESIDDITIPSSREGQPPLRRVDEVFDCWFESGSMPYAQQHYPYENKAKFESTFPADFIAEGLDQTRGWFYTLMVISTALFDKPAFKNLIVNGLVLASDGKKMSKRLKNYPDPTLVVDEYGADSLRLYLINSPVVRAEPLRFNKDGVYQVVKDVFLPWFNVYRMFAQSARRVGADFRPDFAAARSSSNVLDSWINASLQGLIKFVRQEMVPGYRLYTVVPRLLRFIEDLTNWYVRLNRKRLKGDGGESDTRTALSCLYEVLLTMSQLMAPFTPFFAEYVYQKLRVIHPNAGAGDDVPVDAVGKAESIHFVMLPEFDESRIDEAKERQMQYLQAAVELGRKARERRNISLKLPVKSLTLVCADQTILDSVAGVEDYLLGELNARALECTTDEQTWCTLKAEPDNKVLGKRLGRAFKDVKKAIAGLGHEDITTLQADGFLEVAGQRIEASEMQIMRDFKGDKEAYEAAVTADGSMMLVVDVREDDELKRAGIAREFVNRVQKLRKAAGLSVEDRVFVYYREEGGAAGVVAQAVAENRADVEGALHLAPADAAARPEHAVQVAAESSAVAGTTLHVELVRPCVRFAPGVAPAAQKFVASMVFERLQKGANGDVVEVTVDDTTHKLVHGTDFFVTPS